MGDLHFVAVARAREAASGSEELPADAWSRSETHLRSARDALSKAKVLAPDSVDIATALADILIESEMFCEAETEYHRAMEMEMDITAPARPAVNIPFFSSTPSQRREACQLLANRLVLHEVRRILDIETEGSAPTLDISKTDSVLKTEVGAALKTQTEGSARTLHIGKTNSVLKTEVGATLKTQTEGSAHTLDIIKTDGGTVLNTDGGAALKMKTDCSPEEAKVKPALDIGKTNGGAVVNTDGGSALKTKTDGDSLDTKVERNLDSGVASKAAGGVDLTTDGGVQKPDVLAMRILKEARSLANRFPGSARAQLCHLLAQLQHMRSLPRELDMSKGMERLVRSAGSAAQAFPNSVVIALFHAKLLLVSGRLDGAEAECHRALDMEDVSDPGEECIPPGSVGGDNYEARLSSVAEDFDWLLKKITGRAENFWENSLTAEGRQRFLSVKVDALQDEYTKSDQPSLFSVQSALSFFKENNSWRFWMCPLCNSKKKHTMPGPLMEHMYKKHPRSVLPRLRSVVNSILEGESDGLYDGVSFTQDQDTHDIIRFKERSGIFSWLFSETIRGEKSRPFCDIMQENCTEGRKLLEIMKKKMASLPTDKSTTDESPRFNEIRELWLQFLKHTVVDYGKIMLTLARTLIWSEFKKHMAGVHETACQRITADDIDDVFFYIE
ncbi:hypothetical protein QYE76_044430 [Lolium multiflorum]|uniref:DUF629 domain-containing protein n=1 Tax=Lolium multiflorum TaxID=4521 RepID=A0AAD8WWJ4_LOLMU|nr:hypothetical protein QYE76_044430 [Lolium multiflorum]